MNTQLQEFNYETMAGFLKVTFA